MSHGGKSGDIWLGPYTVKIGEGIKLIPNSPPFKTTVNGGTIYGIGDSFDLQNDLFWPSIMLTNIRKYIRN